MKRASRARDPAVARASASASSARFARPVRPSWRAWCVIRSTSRPFSRAVVAWAAMPDSRSSRSAFGRRREASCLTETEIAPRKFSRELIGTTIEATAPRWVRNSRSGGCPWSRSTNSGSSAWRSSHSPQQRVVVGTDAPVGGLEVLPVRRVDRPAAQLAALLVPQVHADAIAVHDGRHGVDEPHRDLVARARGRERAGELQQGARLLVTPLGLGQGGRGVERRRRVAGVHLEQLAFLREETLAVAVHRQQPAVVAAVRAHRNDEPRSRQVLQRRGEDPLGVVVRLVIVEAAMVDVRIATGHRPHREQVARGADLERRAVRDLGEGHVEVAGGDQVRRGREHALQALGHGRELLLQRRRLAGGIGGLGGGGGVPDDAIRAVGRAERGAAVVLDHRGRQAVERGGLRQQAGGPGAMVRVARETLRRDEADLGIAGTDLDRVPDGRDAELRRGGGDLAVDLLGRAERAQQRCDR